MFVRVVSLGRKGADLMTPSRVHLSNVDISAVYLSILNITLHKINRNIIVSLHAAPGKHEICTAKREINGLRIMQSCCALIACV